MADPTDFNRQQDPGFTHQQSPEPWHPLSDLANAWSQGQQQYQSQLGQQGDPNQLIPGGGQNYMNMPGSEYGMGFGPADMGMIGHVAGPFSHTANLPSLVDAWRMQSEGATPAQIYRATRGDTHGEPGFGWFEHSGDWMYENPDINTSFNYDALRPGQTDTFPAQDIYNNENFYRSYPEFRNFPITYHRPHPSDWLTTPEGYYDPAMNQGFPGIYVTGRTPGRFAGGVHTTKEIVEHELPGHAVANLEGFPRGSYGKEPGYELNAGEIMANAGMERSGWSMSKLRQSPMLSYLQRRFPFAQQQINRRGQYRNPWTDPLFRKTRTPKQAERNLQEYIETERQHRLRNMPR